MLPCSLNPLLLLPRASPQDIDAAGSTIDMLHYSLTDARILEAAQRGRGYNASETASFAADLAKLIDKLEYLHQGGRPPGCWKAGPPHRRCPACGLQAALACLELLPGGRSCKRPGGTNLPAFHPSLPP